MATNSMWAEFDNWLTLLLGQSRCLCADYTAGQGQELTVEQSVAILCDTVNHFEAAVNAIGLNKQGIHGDISETSDHGVLIANLQAIDRADASWRQLQSQLLPVQEEYKIVVACKFLSPNDLVPALLDQISRCLNNLMQIMHSHRSWVRKNISALTRSSIRPLNILDLPDELLLMIFGHVKGHHSGTLCEHSLNLWDRNWPQTCDISNVRLTCHRFYNNSSHLLLDYVRLEPQPDSLSRLQEISRHPLIRKGVRSVHVSLGFYHSQLAKDLQHFAVGCYRQFQTDTDNMKLALKFLACDGTTASKFNAAVFDKAHAIQEAWKKFAFFSEVVPGTEAYMDALQACYAMYRKRYEDQQRLLTSEQFSQDVAAALAQMPVLKFLNFGEQYCFCDQSQLSHPWCDFIDDPTSLGATYVRPIATRESNKLGLEPEPPLNLVVDILGAVPGFATGVDSVNIYMNGAANSSLLVPEPHLHEKLGLLAKQLSHISLSILPSERGYGEEAASALAPMEKDIFPFLSAVLDSDSLEHIWLHLGKSGPTSQSFGTILNSQRRTRLRSIQLHHASIHEHEVRRFANSLGSRRHPASEQVEVTLDHPHLLSGSWIDSVESLRSNPKVDLKIQNASGMDNESVNVPY